MERRYEGTNFVTGLRAYAAIAVTLLHCGGAGLRNLGDFGNELADLGATGVYVFFVISGFSVTASYHKLGSVRDFLIRRVMRLAPVYYAFLVIAISLIQLDVVGRNYWATLFDVPLDAYNIVLHALFLGFLDYRINNSIIGVEWSLSVEMFWYILMPPVLAFVESQKRGLGWALSLALIVYFFYKLLVAATLAEASQYVIQWSPVTYAPAFLLGVAAYVLRSQGRALVGRQADRCIALVMGLLLAECFVSLMEIRLLIPLLTFLLLISGNDETGISRMLFNNRVAIFLGTISYSIYLWHPLVIQVLETQGLAELLGQGFLMFVVVSALTIPLSVITYRSIEIPTNRWGRDLARWLSNRQAVLASEQS